MCEHYVEITEIRTRQRFVLRVCSDSKLANILNAKSKGGHSNTSNLCETPGQTQRFYSVCIMYEINNKMLKYRSRNLFFKRIII